MATVILKATNPSLEHVNPADVLPATRIGTSTATYNTFTSSSAGPSKVSSSPPTLGPLASMPAAVPAAMTAVQMTALEGRDRLQLQPSTALPPIYDHDVMIKVHSAAINPIDWKLFNNDLPVFSKRHLPLTLGYDVAGVIVRVGNLVTKFQVGDPVFARCDRTGTFAEYCVTGESSVALKPSKMSFREAASVPLAALTAYQCLVDVAKVTPGQKVFVQAGSGGVGIFAVQIAKILGCHVATTCSARNFQLMKSLGADIVINYRTQRFQDYITDYDVILDSVGGHTLVQSIGCVKQGGVVVEIGGVPATSILRKIGLKPFQSPSVFSMFAKSAFGTWGHESQAKKREARYAYYFMHPDGDELAQIARWIDSGRLKTIIDKSFPLAKLQDAFTYSETGHATGKIVVDVTAQSGEILV